MTTPSQDRPRLIEVAFPLKQASIDSVHEKNVRHGHISTLHIWPARRPLAACRAALIATLLPDPGDAEERKRILEKLGGKVVETTKRKKMPNGKIEEVVGEETVGGILHWGRESSPNLDWFRAKIREAYGGRAPKVLDPFAGGGAIPLEAMRLGCEATAIDINPVAWFILKCTLEYPQKLAGQTRPLPNFILRDRAFMEEFFKAQGLKGATLRTQLEKLGLEDTSTAGVDRELPGMGAATVPLEADLAWHVRAWGHWVLERARADLERFYPIVDGKPTVAYLWARTVKCKHCRATLPLLKTRWLCKKPNKRVVLTMAKPHPPSPSPPSGEGESTGEMTAVPGYVYELCREARQTQTEAESQLWEILRDRRLGGWKFRRQHPLGRYIADFYCADAGLVVEIDGSVHDEPYQRDYDRVRDEVVISRGLRVLRVKNAEIDADLANVSRTILAHLSPSPRDGGGAGGEVNLRRAGESSVVIFGIQTDVPVVGTNAAQRREHDKRVGGGTMSRSGATCPSCGGMMTMEDLRLEGLAGRIEAALTAVVVEGDTGKEYRSPTNGDYHAIAEARSELERAFAEVPFGVPSEPLAGKEALGFRVPLYGYDQWSKLFTDRQLLALGTLVKLTRQARLAIQDYGYAEQWAEAIGSYLALAVDRVANRDSTLCIWNMQAEKIEQTFARFALPILWDFAESNPPFGASGNYEGEIEWEALVCEHLTSAASNAPSPTCSCRSATTTGSSGVDVIVTDPPYYDAIPYSDLMDFFYLWLRRSLYGSSTEICDVFSQPLAPKWDSARNDGELIDDSSRFGGDAGRSKASYEDGMFRSFQGCCQALNPDGRLVIVFAHKQPDAWETLVSAMIRAGFVVVASWPIQTERTGRLRATGSAALSSSVWLVCKKRPEIARPGWDNRVLEEMHEKITTRLRDFWDAGIRGPDFVWSATGPALEAYSKHPIVRKADEPGQVMTVSEFLGHVRRIVVDFVVGRVLSGDGDAEAVSGLDDITTYYMLHRHDFGMEDTPAGACILYAVSCGLSDSALVDQYDLLLRTGGQDTADEDEEAEGGGEVEEGSGSKVKLKQWQQRKRPRMGYEAAGGRPVPLIDQVHRLMLLWKAGEVGAVDEYLDSRGLRRSALFHQILQALIELAAAGSDERALLESISNYVGAKSESMLRLPGV